MRRDGRNTRAIAVHPRATDFYTSHGVGVENKWEKKRVARKQRHYAIRIIKSWLTRRKGRGRGKSRVDASLRITLRPLRYTRYNAVQ